MKRFVSGLMLTILITSMLAFMFNVQPVKGEWTGTVYIRADGSIDPPDAPIITYDNATYMLINNIKSSDDGIIVERDNIVVDGEAYAIEGVQKAGTRGVDLSFRRNVTIRNVNIQQFDIGILIQYSIQNSIVENNITNNLFCGVELDYSSFNNINKNKITNNGNGIGLYESSNNTISRNNVLNKNNGFYFAYSSNNIVYANNIVSCRYDGVRLFGSYSNMFFKNNITNHHTGIDLTQSFGNSISENNIANNSDGISLYVSSNNKIFHNNLMANDRQVYDFAWYHPEIMPSINVWDDSYPSGGNYWSDYHGIDLYSGPYQNETGSDGIGDTPYVIDENNVDHYPLMNPWTPKPSVINATVDIQPQALNLRSIGKWITIYIEFPKGYDVAHINVSTIMLNDTIPVEPKPIIIGDYDNDTIRDLMVKFDRQQVIKYIMANVDLSRLYEERFMTITLTITGKLNNGTPFQGSDTIKIILLILKCWRLLAKLGIYLF